MLENFNLHCCSNRRSFLYCVCFLNKMKLKELVVYQHENIEISKQPKERFFPISPLVYNKAIGNTVTDFQ